MARQTALKVESDHTTTLDLNPVPDEGRLPLTLRAFGMTDKGRVRPGNEDHFLIATLAKTLHGQQTSLRQEEMHYADERGHLMVVADGMGGHRGGERASALAVGCLEHFILNTFKWFFHPGGGEGGAVLNDFR